MSTKLQVTIIIVATLIIGVFLGSVARGVFMRDHRQKLDSVERTELFLSRVNEITDPDSSQKPKVQESQNGRLKRSIFFLNTIRQRW